MFEIKREVAHETEVTKSKFLAFLLPIEQLDERLKALKILHPKARHFIVAYRKYNAHQQIEEYSSDDGEPKGTSGKPSLNVLRGEDLINTAVIVVRYFGGTKLGTGGLVRAYGQAVKAVIEHADKLPFSYRTPIEIITSYEHINRVDYFLQSIDIKSLEKEYLSLEIIVKFLVDQEGREAIQTFCKTERIAKIRS